MRWQLHESLTVSAPRLFFSKEVRISHLSSRFPDFFSCSFRYETPHLHVDIVIMVCVLPACKLNISLTPSITPLKNFKGSFSLTSLDLLPPYRAPSPYFYVFHWNFYVANINTSPLTRRHTCPPLFCPSVFSGNTNVDTAFPDETTYICALTIGVSDLPILYLTDYILASLFSMKAMSCRAQFSRVSLHV